ncbi:MAG: septation regulator SpoVG [Clostridia bacterium]|nr:septation regulator SpoVG [Clostridia bacterium]
MKISDVRVRLVQKEDSKLKAVASITIEDCFVIHDVKVIEGNEGYFVAMPSRKNSDGEYKDIAHPINTETRQNVIDTVLEAFKDELAKV